MARLPAYEARGESEGVGPLQPRLAVARGVLRRAALKEDKPIKCYSNDVVILLECHFKIAAQLGGIFNLHHFRFPHLVW